MTKLTKEEQDKIAELINRMTLSKGIGTRESACSIAAINLALSGKLTDDIPECMSRIIGNWIIGVQDNMPADLRNSSSWKSLLPLAAGTGREHERERVQLILDWVWSDVLPTMQQFYTSVGFFKNRELLSSWNKVLELKTTASCNELAALANEVIKADIMTDDFQVLSEKIGIVHLMSSILCDLEEADNPTKVPSWYSSKEAYSLTKILAANANMFMVIRFCLNLIRHEIPHMPDSNSETKLAEFWVKVDPCKLLERLINVTEENK